MSEIMFVRGGRKEKKTTEPTLENEGIVRDGDIVKGPPCFTKLEKYPARVVGDNINRTRVTVSRLAAKPRHISGRRVGRGEISVEVGVLRESKTHLAFETAEVQKNFWQNRIAGAAIERLCHRIQIQ